MSSFKSLLKETFNNMEGNYSGIGHPDIFYKYIHEEMKDFIYRLIILDDKNIISLKYIIDTENTISDDKINELKKDGWYVKKIIK